MTTFNQVIQHLIEEKIAGHVIDYSINKDYARGRYVMVKTASGWHPDPWWQEYHEESYLGSNDTLEGYL